MRTAPVVYKCLCGNYQRTKNSFPRFTKNHLARHNTRTRIGKIYFLNVFVLFLSLSLLNSFLLFKKKEHRQHETRSRIPT